MAAFDFVETRALSKTYGPTRALSNVDLRFECGTITALDYGIEQVPGLPFEVAVFPAGIIKAGESWPLVYQGVTTEGGPPMLSVSWPDLVTGAHPAYRRIPFR